MSEWRGVVPALITPLTDGGKAVDLDAFADYCSFIAGKGVNGVFCCGTTGEGPLLTVEEKKRLQRPHRAFHFLFTIYRYMPETT